jgi:PAS domain S-box-containing protein
LTESAAAQHVADTGRLLEVILDQAPSIVYMNDLGGGFMYINRRFEEQFGIKRSDFLDHTVFDFFPEELARDYTANDHKALASPNGIEAEEVAQTPVGERVFLSLKFALRDERGEPYALCGISTDTTERVRDDAGNNIELHSVLRHIIDSTLDRIDRLEHRS